MDHPYPSLKYVDAKDLEDKALKLAGLEVDGVDGEKLGKVEGFVLDVNSGRPYHVVVGAGHWFKHKHFLLPIGHVAFDENGRKLTADITKDRVERFPGFDKAEFEKLSKDDLKQLAERMAAACCPADVVIITAWETADHYRYPNWWDASFYRPERIENKDEVGMTGDRGR
jgi:sporulation protein YlmC with PRC-barrel domain